MIRSLPNTFRPVVDQSLSARRADCAFLSRAPMWRQLIMPPPSLGSVAGAIIVGLVEAGEAAESALLPVLVEVAGIFCEPDGG